MSNQLYKPAVFYRGNRSISFVEAILVRPKMYTNGSVTFDDIICFIEEFFAREDLGIHDPSEWFPFRDWLATKSSAPGDQLFQHFRQLYGPNDQTLIAKMLALANEYYDIHP